MDDSFKCTKNTDDKYVLNFSFFSFAFVSFVLGPFNYGFV